MAGQRLERREIEEVGHKREKKKRRVNHHSKLMSAAQVRGGVAFAESKTFPIQLYMSLEALELMSKSIHNSY
jgi:hypothetical protein